MVRVEGFALHWHCKQISVIGKTPHMNPLVSVIIPVYNSERYIERSIGSVLRQTYSNIEIIIVDDGSKDSTAQIVKGIGDPRIVYIYQENRSQGPARNNAISHAHGEFVTFLDSDDIYSPVKVEKELHFLQSNKQYDVVYCNALHFFTGKPDALYKNKGEHPSGNILKWLLSTSLINLNTVMMRTEVFRKVGGFNDKRYFPEEWELWLKCAIAGYRFGYMDEDLVTVEWRRGSNTTMDIQPILKRNAMEMFENLFAKPVSIDGVTYSPDATIKKLKFDMAVAYLVNKDKKSYKREITGLLPMPISVLSTLVVTMVPSPVLAYGLRTAWEQRQKRGYTRAQSTAQRTDSDNLSRPRAAKSA